MAQWDGGLKRQRTAQKVSYDYDPVYHRHCAGRHSHLESWEPEPEASAGTARICPDVRYALTLSETWLPDVRDVAGTSQFVVGFRRSGKTSYGALLAEQLAAKGLPWFIPDLEGDYLTLADRAICSRSYLAGNGPPGPQYAHVTTDTAAQLGELIVKRRVQVVLDMQSYRDIDTACMVTASIIKGMIDFTSEHPEYRVPCAVYLDEAQRFLPESLNASIISDTTIRQEFLKAYNDVIAVGGKRGIYPVILTQRISQVKKSIMAQPELVIAMKQMMDTDLDRYDSLVNRAVATRDQIKAFPPGRAVVIAPDGEQFLVQFGRRVSEHRGSTPTVEAAWRSPAALDMAVSAVSTVSDQGNAGNAAGNGRETARQAGAENIIRDVFPVSSGGDENGAASEEGGAGIVSEETLAIIDRMKKAGLADRDISKFVGLTGRKYRLYQQALIQLGYADQKSAGPETVRS